MSSPIVALLTDFGTRDHYVGAMKGVVLGVCPDVTLVDISHDVPPHDVLAGALELNAVCRYFPAGTIFLVVVDPGVGSKRRAIAVEAGEYRFVAPDNGVLTAVLSAIPAKRGVELTERKYARPTLCRTFEGRDRFAPAAGWLAKGLALESLGLPVSDYCRIEMPGLVLRGNRLAGSVVRVDRFGNLITNIDRATFDRFAPDGHVTIKLAAHAVTGLVTTYSEAPEGSICALFGSTDHLEVAVRGGSAADRLALGRGAPVVIARA